MDYQSKNLRLEAENQFLWPKIKSKGPKIDTKQLPGVQNRLPDS